MEWPEASIEIAKHLGMAVCWAAFWIAAGSPLISLVKGYPNKKE